VNLSHYSTTCIDPSNPGLLWTCQAYSNSKKDRQWCTAWAAFQISDVKRSTPGTGASTGPKRPGYKSFDYTQADHKFRLAVPEGFGVILRKVWGGSRTWAGARAQSVLMSVWRTCWQQGLSALHLLSLLLRGTPVTVTVFPHRLPAGTMR
ncbi:MAG TPA: hypothetical protein VKD72_05150, partial [Gemmataceae bacterium]|nr:hypothetical protein [Gemmataceae bacterium]